MTCLPEHPTQTHLERALRSTDPAGAEISIVELVLFACEASEDAGEIDDLVDAMIDTGAARVLHPGRDPFLTHLQG